MHIALLGRQPELSIAELERRFGDVSWFSAESAVVNTDEVIDIQQLGGSQKIGRVILTVPGRDWRGASMKLVAHYQKAWSAVDGKLTVGISAYGFNVSGRDVQKTGVILKSKLKSSGGSMRLIPNQEASLSTATSHHNKLGLSDNKIELLVIQGRSSVIIAESTGAQNITALAARDQGRPRRDAFVGMLPPKLAQMMINLAGPLSTDSARPRLLDPFCGTGVILQEALLLGYDVYGTDLAEKMVGYTGDNLTWLQRHAPIEGSWDVHEGDAMTTTWQQPINAVVAETYLGQPFSAPPSSAKLTEVRGNCNHIIGSFLKNLHAQLPPGTPVVIAVPAWRSKEGSFTHLPLVSDVSAYGFTLVALQTVRPDQLLYFRPDQVVARELLIMTA
jgi:tRNA G10  N-methylase Trm11